MLVSSSSLILFCWAWTSLVRTVLCIASYWSCSFASLFLCLFCHCFPIFVGFSINSVDFFYFCAFDIMVPFACNVAFLKMRFACIPGLVSLVLLHPFGHVFFGESVALIHLFNNEDFDVVVSYLNIVPLHLETSTKEQTTKVFELDNKQQIIAYHHAAEGYSMKLTGLRAIQQEFYATWPLFTERAIIKHFPKSPKMMKGHMHQPRP